MQPNAHKNTTPGLLELGWIGN